MTDKVTIPALLQISRGAVVTRCREASNLLSHEALRNIAALLKRQ
jgi:hypothetical protein